MLRTVRSLPSLRLLCQQEAVTLKTQVQSKSTYSHTSEDLFQPSTTSVRNVHQTTKKETILLDLSSNKSKYTSMNLQGLKMECKKRGLKVSGRKLDLVQRLVSQDQIGTEISRSYTNISSNKNSKIISPPNPKFAVLDKQIKESKIAQAIKEQKKHNLYSSQKGDPESAKLTKHILNPHNVESNLKEVNGKISGKNCENNGSHSTFFDGSEFGGELKTSIKANDHKMSMKIERKKDDSGLTERKAAQFKLQAQRKEAERKAAELKLQAEKRAAEKKAIELKLKYEKEAAELKLQAQKRDAERRTAELKLQEQRKVAERKAAELKLQAEKRVAERKVTELKLEEEREKIELQTRESIALLAKSIKQTVTKQTSAPEILSKAHEMSKVDVIADAKRHLHERAKLQQQKQKQQQQQQQQQNKMNSRDVKFLTLFGISTAGWWSLKDTTS